MWDLSIPACCSGDDGVIFGEGFASANPRTRDYFDFGRTDWLADGVVSRGQLRGFSLRPIGTCPPAGRDYRARCRDWRSVGILW